MFRDPKLPDEIIREAFKLKETRAWKLEQRRKRIKRDDNWEEKIVRCLYRPFDVRWIFYHRDAVDRGRQEVMRHILSGENLCLLVPRQLGTLGWSHVLVTKEIAESCVVSNKTREQNYNFPLYLYPDPDKKDLFSHLEESKERKPNISKKIFSALSETYKTKPNPEDIFYYIYAVFYSDTYRTKYAEFLKTDFPRVPFTKDKRLFKKLAEYGKRLADLHLMQSPELDFPVVKFQGTSACAEQSAAGRGNKRVDKIKYDKEGESVYINNDQYFEGLEENIWQYRIGGYQVCNKWLKDRKGKVLSLNDIKHYCKLAAAIKHTINIQKSIDEIYNEAEKEIIEF